MALGGNPIFNGKNFREATQAPPVPQAYGQNPYGQTQFGQNQYGQGAYGQAPVMDAPRGWGSQQPGMTGRHVSARNHGSRRAPRPGPAASRLKPGTSPPP